MKAVILFLLCFVMASLQQGVSSQFVNSSNSSMDIDATNDARNLLLKLERDLKSGVRSLLKMVLPKMLENMGNLNLSTECMRNNLMFIEGLRNLKPWAVSLVDSSAKFIDGLMSGSTASLGVFDQCLDTVAVSSRSRGRRKELFHGQYCLLEFRQKLPPLKKAYLMNDVIDGVADLIETDSVAGRLAANMHLFYYGFLKLGVCVPSGCKIEDIREIAGSLASKVNLEAKVEHCQVKEKAKFSTRLNVLIGISAVLLSLVFVATCVDAYIRYLKPTVKSSYLPILLAFSFVKNFERFCNTETQEENLSCLHGVRTLSIFWIVFTHTYLILNFSLVQSLAKLKDWAKDVGFQMVTNGTLAVETFFFMGGMLLCYCTLISVKTHKRPFNVIHFIVYRLWRILPTYYFVYYFALVHPIVTSGPLYSELSVRFLGDCENYWWRPFLLISNLFDAKTLCVPHTWYVAADFQLYLLSLLVLIPMLKWPKVGVILTFAAILGSMVHAGVETYLNDWPPISLVTPDEEYLRSQQNFYIRPFPHITSYAVGIMTGYLLVNKKDLKIPLVIQVIGWCLTVTFTSIAVFPSYKWNAGIRATVIENVLFASTFRLLFTLGVAWVVVCCCTGHGGFVNYVLSLKCWIPLGRLSFLTYLIHPLVAFIYMGSFKTLFQADHFVIVWMAFGHLVVSQLVAFIGSMVIESPFMNLQKIAFGRERIQAPKESQPSIETKEYLKEISQLKWEDKPYLVPCSSVELIAYGLKNPAFNNT